MLDQLLAKIEKNDRMTFCTTFVVAFIVHLFVFTQNLINHDGVYFFYSEQNMSGSGRFFLTYLAGISSYFSLNYLIGILSIIYISVTTTLLLKMFNVQSIVSKFAVIVVYVAFPSISGTFAYMFVADAYFLANLIAVTAIYFLWSNHSKIIHIVIASVLILFALATYQSNLSFILSLLVLLAISELFTQPKLQYRFYINAIISTVIGLVIYFVLYKIYKLKYTVTSYQGLDQIGDISGEVLLTSSLKAIKSTVKFFLSPLTFNNLYEYLNILFFMTIVVVIIIYIWKKHLPLKRACVILVLFCILPFVFHAMYFASPNVFYHALMQQHISVIFIMLITVAEHLYRTNTRLTKYVYTFAQLLVLLIGFNLIVITNIYYEKFSEVNTKVYSVMNQIALDIRHAEQFNPDLEVIVLGTIENHTYITDAYDLATPANEAINHILLYDENTFVLYLEQVIGLKLSLNNNEDAFLATHAQEIENMQAWPAANAIQVLDNTLVIKLSEDD